MPAPKTELKEEEILDTATAERWMALTLGALSQQLVHLGKAGEVDQAAALLGKLDLQLRQVRGALAKRVCPRSVGKAGKA